MKNKISDLRNHMFAALERLNSDDLTEEELKSEIARAQAVSEVGKVIVDSAKTEVMFAKLQGRRGDDFHPTGFLDRGDTDEFSEQKKLQRPPAEYNNGGHIAVAKKYASEDYSAF